MSTDSEILLAEEQSVTAKSGQEIKDVQGSLVLTNRRLLFVAANQEEDSEEVGRTLHFRFTDVVDLDKIPSDPTNLSISLYSISSVKGHASLLEEPKLIVTWEEGSGEHRAEFIQEITGGRKKNLNDWAKVMMGLKSGTINPQILGQQPSSETLEGKAYRILGDMQDKGVLEIENQVELEFKVDLDPDEVEAACNNLVKQGLVDIIPDSSGDSFYKKHSPLGEDDLSS